DSEGTSEVVENYVNTLENEVKDNKTLETTFKNNFGGNNIIQNYNPQNSGAVVLESTNKIYQELELKRQSDKEELQTAMKNFMDQMMTQFANLTTTLSASIQANIIENKSQIEKIRMQMANKAENVEVQQLANVIDNNTVKPMDLTAAVTLVKEEINQNKLSTVKSSDLLPLEQEVNEQGKMVDKYTQEIIALRNRLAVLQREILQLSEKTKEDNTFTQNITKNVKNEMAEKLQVVRNDIRKAIKGLEDKL
ncbi:hypothetical protein BCR36DRAFT_248000, partial [Piromyces finnis]